MPRIFAATITAILFSFGAAAASQAAADPNGGCDWSNFRGPNYNGSSPETGLLREWPAEGPKVLWRAKIKQGWSCPSVSGNDVFVSMTEFEPLLNPSAAFAREANKEVVVCLDATTGQQRWSYDYPTKYNWNQVGWCSGGARATPAVTDKCVYCVDPLGNIRCLDRNTGKLVWEKALAPEFFFKPGMEHKGFNCSPLVYNNVLIVHGATGNKGKDKHLVYVLALDAQTGKQLWLNEDDELTEKTSYAGGTGQSPALLKWNKEPSILLNYNRYLRAIRISDGKELLKFEAVPPGAVDSTVGPFQAGNKIVVTPFGAHMVCAELDFSAPETNAQMAWKSPDYYSINDYNTFVPSKGHIYGINTYSTDGNKVAGSELQLFCLDLNTGKLAWKEPGFTHGYSLITADDLLFVRSFATLWLIDASPQGFKVKGKMEKLHNIETRSMADARGLTDCVMPVLSRGRLYVRCPEELLCLQVAPAKK